MQVLENEQEYLDLTFERMKSSLLPLQVELECLRAFGKLLPLMKPSTFSEQWTCIFDFTWHRLRQSEAYIERVSQGDESSVVDVNDIVVDQSSVPVEEWFGDGERQACQETIYQI